MISCRNDVVLEMKTMILLVLLAFGIKMPSLLSYLVINVNKKTNLSELMV